MQEQIVYKGTDWERFLQQVLLETHCENPMLVCGKHVLKQQSMLDYISNSQYKFTVFTDFQPNPDYEDVVRAVDVFRASNCGAICAVGGGSAIDVAKCVKLYANMNPEKNYLEQEIIPNDIPFLAVPTTAGSGSEATRWCSPWMASSSNKTAPSPMLSRRCQD